MFTLRDGPHTSTPGGHTLNQILGPLEVLWLGLTPSIWLTPSTWFIPDLQVEEGESLKD